MTKCKNCKPKWNKESQDWDVIEGKKLRVIEVDAPSIAKTEAINVAKKHLKHGGTETGPESIETVKYDRRKKKWIIWISAEVK